MKNFREKILGLEKIEPFFKNGDYEVVRDAMEGLSAVERRVISRHFWAVESLTDIASSMGMEWEDVKNILEHGFKKLRALCLCDPRFSRYSSGAATESKVIRLSSRQHVPQKGGNHEPLSAG